MGIQKLDLNVITYRNNIKLGGITLVEIIHTLKTILSENITDYVEEGESTTEKGNLWTKWVLINYFGIPESKTSDLIIDGASDNGIDAFIENEDEGPIVLQCKYGTSHSREAYDNLIGRKERLLSAPIDEFPDRIKPYIVKIRESPEVEILYVTNQEFTCSPNPIGILDIAEIAHEIQRRTLRPWEDKEYTIKVEKQLDHNGTFLSVIKMDEYEKFIKSTQDYIFVSNIRQFLAFRGKINKGIKETLSNDINHFINFNNGVTIVASKVNLIDDNTIHMIEPQVVNGAQTSTVILKAKAEGIDLNDGFISATIIIESEKDIRNDITKFRNSQNAVKGKDLVSLVEEMESIQVEMGLLKDRDSYKGYYFETQPGAFEAMRKSDRARYKGKSSLNKYFNDTTKGYCISSKDAIQASAAAIVGDPESAYSNPGVYYPPNGSKYENLFKADKSISSKNLLVPFIIKNYAKDKLRYQKKLDVDGNPQPLFRRRGTVFYVYAAFCLIKKILNKRIRDEVTDEDVELAYKILQHPSDLGTKLLIETDSIIKSFVEQMAVNKAILKHGADFFKSHIKEFDSEFEFVIDTWKKSPEGLAIIKDIDDIFVRI